MLTRKTIAEMLGVTPKLLRESIESEAGLSASSAAALTQNSSVG